MVDLSNAAAGRREFWVALDAHRRGRAVQVLTFRVIAPGGPSESDLDLMPHALADLEVGGPHETPALVEAVRQRVPVGAARAAEGPAWAGQAGSPLGYSGVGAPGLPGFGMPGPTSQAHRGSAPFGQGQPSPFAHPAAANPFAGPGADSPFDQPDSSNPFAQAAGEGPRDAPPGPYGAPALAWEPLAAGNGNGLAHHMPAPPLGTPPAPWASDGLGRAPGVAPWSDMPGGPRGNPGMAPASGAPFAPPPAPVSDVWVPPDGAMPASNPPPDPLPTASASPPPAETRWPSRDVVDMVSEGPTGPLPPTINLPTFLPATVSALPRGTDTHAGAEESTAPVSAHLPQVPLGSGGLTMPEERALGTVLVDGALLSPDQLAVLKEIRRVLTSVDVEMKLGELALLFRFLSPDQLLAALLVSRQLISPEQIAALGHIKQEMAASGIDYDLETLLVMFNIMTRDDLERLRSELA